MLFINFAFTDEIHIITKIFGKSSLKVIDDVEVTSIEKDRDYYKNVKGKSTSVSCSNIDNNYINFNDSTYNYQFDCKKNKNRTMILEEFTIDENLIYDWSAKEVKIGSNYNYKINTLMESGHLLKQFTNRYYLGSVMNLVGLTFNSLGIINNDLKMSRIGFYTALSGSIISFFSISKVGEAGDKLIQAGKEKQLQESGNNKSVDKNQKQISTTK